MLFQTNKRVRRGSVPVLCAVLAVPLLGMMAFCLDGGMLLDNRRRSQTAADLAALAAATDLYTNWKKNTGSDVSGLALKSAQDNAAANGFDGTTNNTVTVNMNPSKYQGGQWKGQVIPVGYIEVIITYQQPPYFSGIWGQANTQVQARAVARASYRAAKPGVLVLAPSGKATLSGNGNTAIVVTGGGSVIVNSNNAAGGVMVGNGSVSASGFYFTGTPGYSTSGSGQFLNVATGQVDNSIIHSGQQPVPDPLATLPVPTMPATASLPDGSLANTTVKYTGNSNYGSANGTLTLSPGTFNGGISVSGGGSLVLQPGIYYMNGGGLSFTGNGSMTVAGPASPDTGNGVMIYNAPQSNSDTISINGNGTVNIPAPTTGTYSGISIFQDRSSTTPVNVTGNGTMNFGGTFYAAGATLNITGNGTTVEGNPVDNIGAQYISADLSIGGNGSFNINYKGGNPINVRVLELVE